MKKLLLLLFTLIAFSSCSSTKIYPRIKCHICLAHEDGILLLPLHWQESFSQLTSGDRRYLEEMIIEIFREEGFTKIAIYDQMEYELLNAGIKDINDPDQLAQLNLELGISYLINLSLGELAWTGNWEKVDPSDFNSPSYWDTDTQVKSSLRIAMKETATGEIISENSIDTSMGGFPIPIGDDDTIDLNSASLFKAVRISIRKGIKNMMKDCGC
ncbi:hypothetical protein [Algoriphagus sp.]|uniref:hypothetical protein n=1 Tax=Algoriphagus sp. TaxID=1872435 RepID=UPI003278AAFC